MMFDSSSFSRRGGRVLVRFALAVSLSCAGVTFISAKAGAQTPSEKAAAEALFDEGVDLLRAKKYEQACKKLESSQRIDSGIGTLLYLGECYKQVGRTASAWATFREAASKAEAAGESARARAGMERADALEGRLSRVVFEVAEDNRAIEGLEIQQAGLTVTRALWGAAVPVDPGEVKVMAKAPGYESFETMVRVEPGPASMTVSIPALVKLPETEAAPEEGKSAPEGATSMTSADEGSQVGSGRRTLGIVLGSAGLVGIGVGSVFGALAISKNNEAKDACGGSTECPFGSGGQALTDQARTRAAVSTVAFIAGGALLAGGVVIYFTAPKKKESAMVGAPLLRVASTPGGARLALSGHF